MPAPGPVVRAEGLRKSYGSFAAVVDVNLAVEAGEVFALLGPNGAGKTTTVEILEGFRARDAGTVEVLGVDPADRHTERHLRERMGVVLQELAIEPYLTVREVLARNAGYYPHPRPVAEVLELIGLLDKADARVKTLSGGQQRRLDLGLGIVGRPELIFLDEPTTGFDPSARRTAWDLVRSLADEGTTIILTTHYMEEAETLADRVAVLAKGRIVACGAPGSLGGRDRGQVTIRFLVPSGVSPTDLPLRDLPGAQVAIDDGEVVIHTDAELPVLQRLVNWAIAAGVDLPGLTVSHVTLEEVYLRLTGDTADRLDDEAAA